MPMKANGQECNPPSDLWGKSELNGASFHSVAAPMDASGTSGYQLFVDVDEKFLRSTDCGASWDTLRSTPSGGYADIAFLKETSDTILVAEEQKVLMSDDRGSHFERIDEELELGSSERIEDIQILKSTPRTIYVSTSTDTAGKLYRTRDYGRQWQEVTPASDSSFTSYKLIDYKPKYEVWPEIERDTILVKGTSEDSLTLWKGANADGEWQPVDGLLPEEKPIYIGPGKVYGSLLMATRDSIHYTRNFLEGHTNSLALPDTINGIRFLAEFTDDIQDEVPLFVLVSSEGNLLTNFVYPATTWKVYEQGLPDSFTVSSIDYTFITIPNAYIFITDSEEGLYARQMDWFDASVPESASGSGGFKLKANYPNPFNPSTEIRFSLPRAAEVELTVHDLLGRKVATLVDERLPAGSRTVTFDAGNLSSRVYLYRLQTEGYTETRKMMLVK